jgi:hypothetical protein
VAGALLSVATSLSAQVTRVPPANNPNTMVPIQPPGTAFGGSNLPSGATLGVPQFDPYANGPNVGAPGSVFPGRPPASPGFGQPGFGQPNWGQPVYGQSNWGQPLGTTGAPPLANGGTYGSYASDTAAAGGWPAQPSPWRNTPYGGPVTSNPYAYPGQSPNSIFPDGFNLWGQGGPAGEPPLRLFENLRGRHTFLAGSDGREMNINDTEVETTLQLPNFFGLGIPLQVTPGFGIHLWDGPQPPSRSDMPGAAYTAFVEGAFRTDTARSFGADISVSVGVYSDFNAVTTESIRIQTYSFGWVRLTPALTLKAGVNYIDRVDLALLPIVGLYWEPNPQLRLDITFPRPKLARSLGTIGTTDYWIYLAGEYGGGSWTIEHAHDGGPSDQVDINDIRLALGLDFVSQRGLRGNFEVGWVTERRLEYRHLPRENESLRDTYMLRLGLVY